MKPVEREMIRWGKRLFERRLITGWGGNISCRIGRDRFLITGQHAPLGFLSQKDLVVIDREGRSASKKKSSSETPLHLAVYHGTDARAVVHAHPPRVMVFSLSNRSFVPLSFEEKYTIGEIPIVSQDTPTVTQPEAVVEELRLHPIVILRGHGTVAIGKDLKEAFLLTDLLEEAVHCQLMKRDLPQAGPEILEGESRDNPRERQEGYAVFSQEHMRALVDAANADDKFTTQGRRADLTTALSLCVEDEDVAWTVHFDKGRITHLEKGDGGEFLISGKTEFWKAVFQRRIDPFLATQQGKLQLKRGELWKLSRWFSPFQRVFALWQRIPIQ
ncbi:MAG: class II aldolase/adducin family protein [Deltaproteobacteria bacterium]|nr:class II aldolase/adducin family protein [Deltaproteobacteria bacterium]